MASSGPTEVFVHEFVTGGGLAGRDLPASWATEGLAMRRAVADDFASVAGVRVRTSTDPRFAGEQAAPEEIIVGEGREREVIERMAARGVWTILIAPETGGLLRERAGWIEAAGGRSLGSSPSSIDLCGDKERLGRHLKDAGLPVPEGRRIDPEAGLPDDFPYPGVLKPNDGAGCLETYLLRGPGEGPRPIPDGSLLQPLVAGEAFSAGLLVGKDGRGRLVGIGRQRVEVEGGLFHYRGGVVPAGEESWGTLAMRAIDAVPGLRGWVGVDFVAGGGRTIVLEINPRPTTSFVGWSRWLGPGRIASAWLQGLGVGGPRSRDLSPIAGRGPVTFLADGTIVEGWV